MKSYAPQADRFGFVPFEGRIVPRHPTDGPTVGIYKSVPRGSEPVSKHRPVLAAFSIVIFLAAIWVQVGRYDECRSAGGSVMSCLVDP